jgi:hypothetical protein
MGTSTEAAMKRAVLILGVAVLTVGLVQSAMAQATANQSVTLAVSANRDGADAGQAIGYSFSANASAGTLSSSKDCHSYFDKLL